MWCHHCRRLTTIYAGHSPGCPDAPPPIGELPDRDDWSPARSHATAPSVPATPPPVPATAPRAARRATATPALRRAATALLVAFLTVCVGAAIAVLITGCGDCCSPADRARGHTCTDVVDAAGHTTQECVGVATAPTQ